MNIGAPRIVSLESEFEHLITADVDTRKDPNYDEYLEPNEFNPEKMIPHLERAKEGGLLVVTGTERAFFSLIFSKNAFGLVSVDINPRVKGYVDLNTIMLRISKNAEEYRWLSEHPNARNSLEDRMKIIFGKVQELEISEKLRDYYIKHLDAFAKIYFEDSKGLWKTIAAQFFKKCHYWANELQFKKLRDYVVNGRIISVTGDINDLRFLSGIPIPVSVVDISNIFNFSVIDLCEPKGFAPRVISSLPRYDEFLPTLYTSYTHIDLTLQQRKKIAGHFEVLSSLVHPRQLDKEILSWVYFSYLKTEEVDLEKEGFKRIMLEFFRCFRIYTPKMLTMLEKIEKKLYLVKQIFEVHEKNWGL